MCFKAARMGMISSRQRVLRGMSKMAVQPSRSWGSKGLRMVKTFEEWTARTAEIGGDRHFPRIDTENPRDLRGENQPPTPVKIASCQLSDGHSLLRGRVPSGLGPGTALLLLVAGRAAVLCRRRQRPQAAE